VDDRVGRGVDKENLRREGVRSEYESGIDAEAVDRGLTPRLA
jgi:hypothetical protein